MARIVIVGSGTMGTGIAEVALKAGDELVVVDPAPDALKRAEGRLHERLWHEHEKGRLGGVVDDYWGRVQWRERLPDGTIDWVIEAAPEDIVLKQSLFREFDEKYPETVWLASNTSSIAISRLQAHAKHCPGRIGGLHFFNPVPRMKLVEIVQGRDTEEAYRAAAQGLVSRWGKTGIGVPDEPGFLVNRVARPYYLEALRLVDEGVATLQTVDQVMEGAGWPMGPFRVMDLVGVDVNLAVTRAVWEQTYYDERYRPHAWQEQLVERGHWGRKSGRGFYRYE